MVVVGGILTMWAATLLLPEEGAAPLMERAIVIASILSGGTLGVVCLGFFTRTATRRGCYVGMVACAIYTAWAILTRPNGRVIDMGFNYELNPLLIGIIGHLVLFSSGWLASRILGGYVPPNVERLTYQTLRELKASREAESNAAA
jgi:SSS family solute:Na+ symporter